MTITVHRSYNSDSLLQNTAICVILSPYSEYGKEENRAPYDRQGGLLHAGRSCRSSQHQAGKCNKAVTSGENAGLQVWRFLAYRQRRVCTVSKSSEKQVPVRPGKLTGCISLSAATRKSQTSFQPVCDLLWCVAAMCSLWHNPRQFATLHTMKHGSVQTKENAMEQPPICAWCPCDKPRPAVRRYGSIPLCNRCYRYAAIESDLATRERLEQPWKVEREVRV